MSRNDVRTQLQRVFEDVFDEDDLELSDEMTREAFASWDSLGHIRLVAAAEESFGISFTIEEIETMTSVGRIVDLVTAKV